MGLHLSSNARSHVDEYPDTQSFYIDIDGSIDNTLPFHTRFATTAYYSLGLATSLGEEPATVPPAAESRAPNGRACFNCGGISHILSSCPAPRNQATIDAASRAYRQDNPSAGFKRFHEAAADMYWRLDCLNRFVPGRIQLPELRNALGLDDLFLSDLERRRKSDELPWYAGDWGNRGMIVWGYPPGFYASERMCPAICSIQLTLTVKTDPTETVKRRILGPDEPHDDVSLKIFDGDGFEESTAEVGADMEDRKTSDVETKSEPRPLQRWVPYPTTLFQWELLPVSQVYVPIFALPTPTSQIPSVLLQETSKPSPQALVGQSQTFTYDRRNLWDRIIRGEPQSVPWRDPALWVSNFWHRVPLDADHRPSTNPLIDSSGHNNHPDTDSDMDFSDSD